MRPRLAATAGTYSEKTGSVALLLLLVPPALAVGSEQMKAGDRMACTQTHSPNKHVARPLERQRSVNVVDDRIGYFGRGGGDRQPWLQVERAGQTKQDCFLDCRAFRQLLQLQYRRLIDNLGATHGNFINLYDS